MRDIFAAELRHELSAGRIRSAQDVLDILVCTSPPIDIYSICLAAGASMVYFPEIDPNVDGACDVRDGNVRFFVTRGLSMERKRLALAWSLGYLVTNTHNTFSKFGAAPARESDRASHTFALEILMPEHCVLGRSAAYGRDPCSMAPVFCVPVEAMTWRLRSLGLIK